jgi:hypothetical protein
MNNDPLAPAFERLGDQLVVMAAAVTGRCVQKVDAQIESAVQGGDGFGIVGGSISARHAHAADTHGRNFEFRGSKLAILHCTSSGIFLVPTVIAGGEIKSNLSTRNPKFFWLGSAACQPRLQTKETARSSFQPGH